MFTKGKLVRCTQVQHVRISHETDTQLCVMTRTGEARVDLCHVHRAAISIIGSFSQINQSNRDV